MKKTAIILLVLIISLSSVFATDSSFSKIPELENTIGKSVYRPRFATRFNTLAYRIWDNPAELAGGKFILDLPEISFSVNNVAANLNSEFFGFLTSSPTVMQTEAMIKAFDKYFKTLGTGSNTTNEILRTDVGFGFEIGGFAMRADVNASYNTYNASGETSVTSVKIVPEVNAALSLVFGFKIIDTDQLTLKAGVSVHPSIKTFTKGIGATDIIAQVGNINNIDVDDPTVLASMLFGDEMYVGVAVPFDLSASVGFFNDRLKVYAKANNILGTYHFVNGDLNEISGLASDYQKILKSEKTFGTAPVEIDLGVTAETNFIGIHPVVYAEFNNAYAYFKDMFETEVFTWTDLLAQFNFGAQVSLFKVIKLGFGYEDGYRQIAAGVGINDICVQAMYGAHKYNNNATDTLSVVIKLGWDANK